MEKDIDLSGVDPARWPEIRRRVGILDAYVAIERPTVRQTDAHAERMGLKRSTFYALARTWRDKRDPRKVAGSGASKGRRARNETNDLPDATIALIRTVIDEMGPWAEDRLILRAVHARLLASGCAKASDQTVRHLLDQTRTSRTDRSPFCPAILIERCHFRLPLAQGEAVVLPAVCLAVALPENVVVAYRLGTDAAPPSAMDVLADLRALSIRGSARRPLIAPVIEDELPEGSSDIPDDALARVRLRRVLGGSIGGVEFLVQSRAGGQSAAPRTRFEKPLLQRDVDVAVAEAITRHNDARGGIPDFSL